MAKTPQISVIERRLQSPNAFRTGSRPIPLADPKTWTARWINTKSAPDRLGDVLHNKGWEYMEPSDLACEPAEFGAQLRDGRIVSGERGEEVLMKMRTKDYAKLAKVKDEQTKQQTFGKPQLKTAIVSEVAAAHGDQAAEFMNKHVNMVTVQDARGPEDGTA